MLEREEAGERAIIVNVHGSGSDSNEQLAEFLELAEAASVSITEIIDAPQKKAAHPRFLVGAGKAEQVAAAAAGAAAKVIIFNRELTPGQARNLERLSRCRVIDRIDLILDIFAQRARSFEGKLQVELAQLEHLATRLVRGWTHLERQKGGIGLRGPGETQLETDRRLIGRRIRQINDRLAKVRRQRSDTTRARRRAHLSTVSLVGYTNAGKSTLFNALTGAGSHTAGKMFATLDTTSRRLEVPGENPLLVSDTVGFIRDLPHELIAAFHATLEETRQASLLLHVVDATVADRDERIDEVSRVLAEIGARGVPVIEVFNKIDCVDNRRPHLDRDADGNPRAVWISAHTGQGVDLLIGAVAEYINRGKARRWVHLPARAGRLRARLYDMGAVFNEAITANGWALELAIDDSRLRALWGSEGLPPPPGEQAVVTHADLVSA